MNLQKLILKTILINIIKSNDFNIIFAHIHTKMKETTLNIVDKQFFSP